jgi:hypothetical protein
LIEFLSRSVVVIFDLHMNLLSSPYLLIAQIIKVDRKEDIESESLG